jgi:hypothetical protein
MKREEQGYLVMPADLLDLTRRGQWTSPAIDLINQITFCFNSGVSYLKPLYGTVGDGASWSTEEIGPSRDKAVPALSRLTRMRGSILSGMEGSQPAGMTFS